MIFYFKKCYVVTFIYKSLFKYCLYYALFNVKSYHYFPLFLIKFFIHK